MPFSFRNKFDAFSIAFRCNCVSFQAPRSRSSQRAKSLDEFNQNPKLSDLHQITRRSVNIEAAYIYVCMAIHRFCRKQP